MKTYTLKIEEKTFEKLKAEAKASGRSIASLVRERIEVPTAADTPTTVYAVSADLAGSLEGGNQSATNARKKFTR